MSLDTFKVINLEIDTHRYEHNMFKGMDGRSYSTPEALARADEAWKRQYLIEIDPTTGKKKYVPAFREETF